MLFAYHPIYLFSYDSFSAEKNSASFCCGNIISGDPPVLKETIQKLFEQVPTVPNTNDKLIACVVPHSGCGSVWRFDCSCFCRGERGRIDEVIILAPTHISKNTGLFIAICSGFCHSVGCNSGRLRKIRTHGSLSLYSYASITKNCPSRKI